MDELMEVIAALKAAGIETDDPAAGVRELAAQRDHWPKVEAAAHDVIVRWAMDQAGRPRGEECSAELAEAIEALRDCMPRDAVEASMTAEEHADCAAAAAAGRLLQVRGSQPPSDKAPAPEPRQPKFRPGDRVALTCSDSPGTGTVAEVDTSDGGIGYRIHHHQLKQRLYFGEAVVIPEPIPGKPAEAEPSALVCDGIDWNETAEGPKPVAAEPSAPPVSSRASLPVCDHDECPRTKCTREPAEAEPSAPERDMRKCAECGVRGGHERMCMYGPILHNDAPSTNAPRTPETAVPAKCTCPPGGPVCIGCPEHDPWDETAEPALRDLDADEIAAAGIGPFLPAEPVPTRDESVPPPGWRVYEQNGGTPEAYWEVARADDDAGSTDWEHRSSALHDAWRAYDAEHGYAPDLAAAQETIRRLTEERDSLLAVIASDRGTEATS